MREELIGHVGVDSGQLLLCDPCYIDSIWEEEHFKDIRKHQHKTTGDILQYQVDFATYESPIPHYDGKTMNQLNATGEWEQIDAHEVEAEFSYNGCCKATLSEQGHGELGDCTGVAFRTAWGDGVYPVFANYGDDGNLKSVTVKFTDDDE